MYVIQIWIWIEFDIFDYIYFLMPNELRFTWTYFILLEVNQISS